MRAVYITLALVTILVCSLTTTCCTIGVEAPATLDMPEMPDTLIVRHVFEDTYTRVLLALPPTCCVDLEALDYFVLGTLADDLEEGYTVARIATEYPMLRVTLEKDGDRRHYATPRVLLNRQRSPDGEFLYGGSAK